MSLRGVRVACAAVLGAGLVGCLAPDAPAPLPHTPTRAAYRAFAERTPGLYEPNYLPFMLHQHRTGAESATLFVCRWPEEAMPLSVALQVDAIPDALQRDFHARSPGAYAEAVSEALAVWERALEGHVRFRVVGATEPHDVQIRLRAEQAPVPSEEKQVLGVASVAGACRVAGEGTPETLDVRFAAPSVELYLADVHGLLTPDQVHRVALHEIGHALGMRGHSPIPADLMYAVARDRLQVAEGLSEQDVNSFLSLYALPNGAVYGALPGAAPAPQEAAASDLSPAPHVDARHGFRLRLPDGWTHFATAHGVVAVDGTTWDYAASLQVAVQRYATIDEFLARYGPYYLQRGIVSAPRRVDVAGRHAMRSEIRLRDAPRSEQITLIEVGDGRLLVVTADAPTERMADFRPVFAAVLASLRIRDHPEDAWPSRR